MAFQRFFTLLVIIIVEIFQYIDWVHDRTLLLWFEPEGNAPLPYILDRIESAIIDVPEFFGSWYREYYNMSDEDYCEDILKITLFLTQLTG